MQEQVTPVGIKMLSGVLKHLETQAHVAGKVTYSWQLNDIMADDAKFRGDPDKLARLEAATTQGTEAQRKQLEKHMTLMRISIATLLTKVLLKPKTEMVMPSLTKAVVKIIEKKLRNYFSSMQMQLAFKTQQKIFCLVK